MNRDGKPQKESHGSLTGLRVPERGTDVIKVEAPGGDPVRQWGRQVEGAGAPWTSMHQRNERSLVLDLKDPRAVAIVLKLASPCDAVIENFRPGQSERMGLGREALDLKRM